MLKTHSGPKGSANVFPPDLIAYFNDVGDNMSNDSVVIIGAGLSGCEAALQLAASGINVTLYDQKPAFTPGAYQMHSLAELVCNNSLGPVDNNKPLGLLLSELQLIDSFLVRIALDSMVDDERYVAVNKRVFSEKVTDLITHHPQINLVSKCVSSLPPDEITIVASGPLTNEALLHDISQKYGMTRYHFSDSSCAIVDINSIDLNNACVKKESDDLYSITIPDSVFTEFSDRLAAYYSCQDKQHGLVECQSIERLASKGEAILSNTRFNHSGFPPNCLLLRREGALENGYIMVGCMTTLRHYQQLSAFSLLPGFSKMRMVRYGRMHYNTFFHTPGFLDSFFNIQNSNVFIVGQLSGLDGYCPAIASGLIAAQRIIYGKSLFPFPAKTMMGGLSNYVCNTNVVDYQPMCASFALLHGGKEKSKSLMAIKEMHRYKEYIHSLKSIRSST